MKKKALSRIYFTGLIVSFVTFVSILSGCAQVYYGTFRYEAQCVDGSAQRGSICTVEKKK